MTTLNAKANAAYHALVAETERENPGDVWAGFENERDAFEAGYEAAASQPVDRVTDEVAFAALGAFEAARVQRGLSRLEALRAALEAALPHLASRPVVDREALGKTLTGRWVTSDAGQHRLTAEDADDLADAVLALLNGTESPYGRNVGCCALAAGTEGRQHFPVCVNGERGSEWGGGR